MPDGSRMAEASLTLDIVAPFFNEARLSTLSLVGSARPPRLVHFHTIH